MKIPYRNISLFVFLGGGYSFLFFLHRLFACDLKLRKDSNTYMHSELTQ